MMRTAPRILGLVAATTLLLVGCSSRHPSPAPNRQSGATAASASNSAAPVIPTESPRPTAGSNAVTVRPDPAITLPSIPAPSQATQTPLATARAWAVAANSSSYLDPAPGSWTERARPLVTGAEAAAEQRQRNGGGGSTWTQIQTAKCVTSLRQLTTGIPSRDVPTGPDLHIVYASAVIALTCATGQVQLAQFTAQFTVTRVHGHWFVTDVLH
jgi:hypothetical protein